MVPWSVFGGCENRYVAVHELRGAKGSPPEEDLARRQPELSRRVVIFSGNAEEFLAWAMYNIHAVDLSTAQRAAVARVLVDIRRCARYHPARRSRAALHCCLPSLTTNPPLLSPALLLRMLRHRLLHLLLSTTTTTTTIREPTRQAVRRRVRARAQPRGPLLQLYAVPVLAPRRPPASPGLRGRRRGQGPLPHAPLPDGLRAVPLRAPQLLVAALCREAGWRSGAPPHRFLPRHLAWSLHLHPHAQEPRQWPRRSPG